MSIQIIFLVVVGITITSGIAATSIVMLGDTRGNAGQRAVAERFARIAVIGATAIAALLANFPAG
jgi:hypothetical protein